jgi:hypothetical protein
LLNGSSMLPFRFSVGLQFMQECIIDGSRYLNLLEMLLYFEIISHECLCINDFYNKS